MSIKSDKVKIKFDRWIAEMYVCVRVCFRYAVENCSRWQNSSSFHFQTDENKTTKTHIISTIFV